MSYWPVPKVLDNRGRPRSTAPQSWDKQMLIDGVLHDVSPAPGRTYTRMTYPPRGRGRGESLCSVRRINAKIRALECFRLRADGHTWQHIGQMTGLSTSGAYRAVQRAKDRVAWDEKRKQELKQA